MASCEWRENGDEENRVKRGGAFSQGAEERPAGMKASATWKQEERTTEYELAPVFRGRLVFSSMRSYCAAKNRNRCTLPAAFAESVPDTTSPSLVHFDGWFSRQFRVVHLL